MMRKLLLALIILLSLGILVGCGGEEETTETLPEISQESIDLAKEQIKQYDMVKDAAIVVEGNYVALAIVINKSATEEYAKELGQNFAEIFGGVTASLNDELEGSTSDNLGDIYNYYNLSLAVATGSEDIIADGTKATDVDNITWSKR